ncbi:hypothetical protein I5Q82_03210 [Acutalibacter muris]|jgi:hypothetical protein|uniref:DNA-binding protein n=1 Tax=Acutalibacter muris TaxID=1796620 RepID=A0A1Z2XSP7_9FIRM|nr:hypothetical protein [Acutalibacter muris]ANU55297.1 hypothetical protein A4V00_15450 [Hungateiclostridiaceae bacterium KB18]ASB41467.1 hypothetical protein ADH66_12885 [Acutalibacter muris]QQR30726.1 hypothetical protein I5Q82_03210 [Acutalibacter muris]
MAVNYDVPMTWKDFKALEKEEQRDYLQHLIDTYGANAVSFAQMFKINANTVRRYISDNDVGIKLSRGSRVDRARWNEFLGVQETEEKAAEVVQPQPVSCGMQVCSATMRFCGAIDVDMITADLKRVFDGNTQGEIEITFTLKGE